MDSGTLWNVGMWILMTGKMWTDGEAERERGWDQQK